MKSKVLYYCLIFVSFLLILCALFIFDDTKFVGAILLVLSVYLFLGSIIKLCKMNDKLKNTILCMIDLLFWLP